MPTVGRYGERQLMRKAQKQEALSLLGSFYQAHGEIRQALDKKNWESVKNMLRECQEYAIFLGEYIEGSEGQGQAAVACLEEYCELLFRVNEEADARYSNGGETERLLTKQLRKAERSIRNDIRERKEVVFFPYKASMWDSLESVYLAARADPDCDVYCVPVPYYDLKPDHSFGEMHYEGREYPGNIEITHWQDYSLEDRKPDMVFIHNPYDGWNYVTSVHPRFYAENLKKYTERLVYIPYFVSGEIDAGNREAVDRMKHFVFLPGVIYADRVIVQSENMRQIYIREYQEAARKAGLGGAHLDRRYLGQKFLGLGSPKLDRVRSADKENLEIPEGWRGILQRADGSRKKVILYNTSIQAFLDHEAAMLEKIRRVFGFFHSRQDEIALLWRPHPLLSATIRSMRPHLWKAYQEITEGYRTEGWGIYDDSPDVERAVLLCDGYFGDASSVVKLCESAGKPVMIQDAEGV